MKILKILAFGPFFFQCALNREVYSCSNLFVSFKDRNFFTGIILCTNPDQNIIQREIFKTTQMFKHISGSFLKMFVTKLTQLMSNNEIVKKQVPYLEDP